MSVVAVLMGLPASCDYGGTVNETEDTPMVYLCTCGCINPQGVLETGEPSSLCAVNAFAAADDCATLCNKGDIEGGPASNGVDCSPTGSPLPTDDICTPDAEGQSLDSSGDPESTDATLDEGESTTRMMILGEPITVAVGGDINFTGGCASGSCPIVFHQIRLHPADFTVRDAAGRTLRMSEVTVVNVGDVRATLTDGAFVIPRSSMRVLARADVDGVAHALTLTPAQDLEGHYLPSRGTFGLYGDLVSGTTLGLSFDLANGTIRRPPTAHAGRSQSVVLPSGATTVMVTLDGSRSTDLDGNLQHVDWYSGRTYLGRGSILRRPFARGQHVVTAIAVDSTRKTNAATTTVTVR